MALCYETFQILRFRRYDVRHKLGNGLRRGWRVLANSDQQLGHRVDEDLQVAAPGGPSGEDGALKKREILELRCDES